MAHQPTTNGYLEPDDEVEAIRAKMRRVRGRLNRDLDSVRESAHDALDWESYVERYPLTTVAVAAAAGYFLVPGGKSDPESKLYLTDDQFERLRKDGKIEAGGDDTSRAAWKSVLLTAGTFAVRAAIGQVVGRLTQRAESSGNLPDALSTED